MNIKAEIKKAVKFGMMAMCKEFEVEPPVKFIQQNAKDYANELKHDLPTDQEIDTMFRLSPNSGFLDYEIKHQRKGAKQLRDYLKNQK